MSQRWYERLFDSKISMLVVVGVLSSRSLFWRASNNCLEELNGDVTWEGRVKRVRFVLLFAEECRQGVLQECHNDALDKRDAWTSSGSRKASQKPVMRWCSVPMRSRSLCRWVFETFLCRMVCSEVIQCSGWQGRTLGESRGKQCVAVPSFRSQVRKHQRFLSESISDSKPKTRPLAASNSAV